MCVLRNVGFRRRRFFKMQVNCVSALLSSVYSLHSPSPLSFIQIFFSRIGPGFVLHCCFGGFLTHPPSHFCANGVCIRSRNARPSLHRRRTKYVWGANDEGHIDVCIRCLFFLRF